MKAIPIEGMTRDLTKPSDWDEQRDGTCGSLPIRDQDFLFGNGMVSNWKPSALDLEVLNAGGVIQLVVCGTVHPPVSITVQKEG